MGYTDVATKKNTEQIVANYLNGMKIPVTTTNVQNAISSLPKQVEVKAPIYDSAPSQRITNTITKTEETNTGNGNSTTSNSTSSNNSLYEKYYNQLISEQEENLKAAAEERQNQLTENYNRALGVLQNNHQNEVNNLQNSANESMRQAYINYMLGQKNINQTLSNMGVNGGATESILANLYNNYGANRNSIANELQNGLANIGSNYDSSVADLTNTYGENLADVLANYYNQVSSAKENYANKIASLLNTSSSKIGSSSSSKSSEDDNSDLLNTYIQNVKSMIQNGRTSAEIKAYLDENGLGTDTNKSIILQAGGTPSTYYGTGTTVTNNNTSSGTTGFEGSDYDRSGYDYSTTVNDLKKVRGQFASSSDFMDWANNYLTKLQAQYGLSDSEILRIAGNFV